MMPLGHFLAVESEKERVWQWVRHGATLTDGRSVTADLVRQIAEEELRKIAAQMGKESFAAGQFDMARAVFEQIALSDPFIDFLTIPAYAHID